MEAMEDAPQNKARRMKLMRRQVVENDIDKWANTFLDDLERLTRTPERPSSRLSVPALPSRFMRRPLRPPSDLGALPGVPRRIDRDRGQQDWAHGCVIGGMIMALVGSSDWLSECGGGASPWRQSPSRSRQRRHEY